MYLLTWKLPEVKWLTPCRCIARFYLDLWGRLLGTWGAKECHIEIRIHFRKLPIMLFTDLTNVYGHLAMIQSGLHHGSP